MLAFKDVYGILGLNGFHPQHKSITTLGVDFGKFQQAEKFNDFECHQDEILTRIFSELGDPYDFLYEVSYKETL
jgi:hypothetical protein